MLDAFHIVKLAGDAPGEVRRRVQQDTTGHRGRKGDPLYQIRNLCAPRVIDSRSVNKNDSMRPSRQMRRISVSKSPTFTGQSAGGLPSSHTRPRPTPGRSSHREPTKVSHPRNHSPRGEPYASGRTHSTPYFDTGGASNGPTEAINGHYRAGQTHRQRLPQPHQLPTPNAPHRRRPRRLHPHPTMKSPYKCDMRIRLASPDDLEFIESAYEHARAFMRENGNATQWPDGYPGRIDAEEDIAHGHCFLVADDEGRSPSFLSLPGQTRPTRRSMAHGIPTPTTT